MMPACLVLRTIETFSLGGMGNDAGRLSFGAALQRGTDLGVVMAVDLDYMEAEGLCLGRQILQRHDILCVAADLQMIPVNDPGKIGQAEFCRGHGCFPVASLCQLTVACHHKDPVVLPVHFQGQGHTGSKAKSMSQGTCICLYAVHLLGGMAAKLCVQLSEGIQYLLADISIVMKNGVKGFCRMSLAQDEIIPAIPFRVLRIMLHIIIKIDQHICLGKVAPNMPAVPADDDLHRFLTDICCLQFQFPDFFLCHAHIILPIF